MSKLNLSTISDIPFFGEAEFIRTNADALDEQSLSAIEQHLVTMDLHMGALMDLVNFGLEHLHEQGNSDIAASEGSAALAMISAIHRYLMDCREEITEIRASKDWEAPEVSKAN